MVEIQTNQANSDCKLTVGVRVGNERVCFPPLQRQELLKQATGGIFREESSSEEVKIVK